MSCLFLVSQDVKDWLQAIAWIAATIGVVVALIKFRSELKLGRLQREQELRWRQAEVGKALNDEMQTDDLAWAAMQILDADTARNFTAPDKMRYSISFTDIEPALKAGVRREDDKTKYIQDCFDSFFYFMAMLEHYIANQLILVEDVAYPIDYYLKRMKKAGLKPAIEAYLKECERTRSLAFFHRDLKEIADTKKLNHR